MEVKKDHSTETPNMARIDTKPVIFAFNADGTLPVVLNNDEKRVKRFFNNLRSIRIVLSWILHRANGLRLFVKIKEIKNTSFRSPLEVIFYDT